MDRITLKKLRNFFKQKFIIKRLKLKAEQIKMIRSFYRR